MFFALSARAAGDWEISRKERETERPTSQPFTAYKHSCPAQSSFASQVLALDGLEDAGAVRYCVEELARLMRRTTADSKRVCLSVCLSVCVCMCVCWVVLVCVCVCVCTLTFISPLPMRVRTH